MPRWSVVLVVGTLLLLLWVVWSGAASGAGLEVVGSSSSTTTTTTTTTTTPTGTPSTTSTPTPTPSPTPNNAAAGSTAGAGDAKPPDAPDAKPNAPDAKPNAPDAKPDAPAAKPDDPNAVVAAAADVVYATDDSAGPEQDLAATRWRPFPKDRPDLYWRLPLRKDVLPDPPSLPPPPPGKTRGRVAIVTFMFGAAAVEKHADALASMACYAAHHGYPYYVEPLDLVARQPVLKALPSRLGSDYEKLHYNKVLVLQKYLPHFDWVLMVDGDVFPLNRTAPLEPFLDDRFVVITQRRPGGEIWPNGFWRNDPKAFMILQLWMSCLTSGWAGNGDNGPYIDVLLQVALPGEYNAPGGCGELWHNTSRAMHGRLATDAGRQWHRWVDCYNDLLHRRYEHPPFLKLYGTMAGFMRTAELNDGNNVCHSTWQPGDVFGHGKGFKRFIKTRPNVLCDHNEPHADERVMTITRAEWDTFRDKCRGGVMHPDDFDAKFARFYPPHPDAAAVPLVRTPQKRKPPTPTDDDTK